MIDLIDCKILKRLHRSALLTHKKERYRRCHAADYCFLSPRFRFAHFFFCFFLLRVLFFCFFTSIDKRFSSFFCRTKKIKCPRRRRVSFHPLREAEEAPTSSSARRAAPRRAREASRRARAVLLRRRRRRRLPLPLPLPLLLRKISFAWEKGSRYSPPFLRRSFSPPRAGGRFSWRVIWCFHRPRTRKRTTRVCPSLRARTLRGRQKVKS